MIIATDAEKALDNIQHSFVITSLNKLGIEGLYFNITKAIYHKSTTTICEKLSFSSKIRKKSKDTHSLCNP
jgi:hypothetical protein